MTSAQGDEGRSFDWAEAGKLYWNARRAKPTDLFIDWFQAQVAAFRFPDPIDWLEVGPGDGALSLFLFQILTSYGVTVRSLTLVEPDYFVLSRLDSKIRRMQGQFPDTTFRIVPVHLEDFQPVDPIPPQFHLVTTHHVYPYLSDHEHCSALLTDKLVRPDGYSIVVCQMREGLCAFIQELCQTPGWLYTDHAYRLHIGMLQEWADRSGARYRLDVLDDAINVSSCLRDTWQGQLILSVMVGHKLPGCPPEILARAREILSRYCDPALSANPAQRIIPNPFGVLLVYGKDTR